MYVGGEYGQAAAVVRPDRVYSAAMRVCREIAIHGLVARLTDVRAAV